MSSQNDRELNQLIVTGKALDGFEKFYADDVSMQENNEPATTGKDVNRQREIDFFGSIETVNEFALVHEAATDDVSFSEWIMDVVLKNGYHMKSRQVARRTWKDGKIVEERFFYNKG